MVALALLAVTLLQAPLAEEVPRTRTVAQKPKVPLSACHLPSHTVVWKSQELQRERFLAVLAEVAIRTRLVTHGACEALCAAARAGGAVTRSIVVADALVLAP